MILIHPKNELIIMQLVWFNTPNSQMNFFLHFLYIPCVKLYVVKTPFCNFQIIQ